MVSFPKSQLARARVNDNHAIDARLGLVHEHAEVPPEVDESALLVEQLDLDPRDVADRIGLNLVDRRELVGRNAGWPDGESSASYRVFANQFVVIDRTKPQAAYWYPGR